MQSMGQMFAMRSGVKFEDKLTYSKLKTTTKPCSFDPSHNILERWERPLEVIAPVRPFTDFEWTVYGDLIVTNDVKTVLIEAGFTGVRFRQVNFFSSSKSPFGRDSVELEVIGWGGRARKESGIEILEECPGCRRREYLGYEHPSMLFNASEWDGSDVFMIWPMPRVIFITDTVRRSILNWKFSGVKFVEISAFRTPAAGFTPPSLESIFDEDRARQIKEMDPGWWYGSNDGLIRS